MKNIRLIRCMCLVICFLLADTINSSAQKKKIVVGRQGEKIAVERKDTVETILVNELYQARPFSRITASISTIDGTAISRNSVHTFGNILYGRLPGLTVKQGQGSPGNDDVAALYIRGKHTFTGSNAPLVLIDGFERPLSSLTVDEVESISVLKDAASTALYGMDGANGVVLITTRRGTKGGNVSVNFKSEFGIDAPVSVHEFYNAYEFANAYNTAQANDGVSENLRRFTPAQLEGYKNNTDSKLYPDVNWFDEVLRKQSPLTQKYSLNVDGSNATAKYFVNIGYEEADGIYEDAGQKSYSSNNSMGRFNLRTNLDVKIGKSLLVKIGLAGRLENFDAPYQDEKSLWTNLYTYNPNTTAIFAKEGTWGGTNLSRNNPVAYLNDQGFTHTHRRLFQTNITLDYDLSPLVKNLHVGVRASYDNFYSVQNGYNKTFAVRQVTGISADGPNAGEYTLSDEYGTNSILKTFGPDNQTQYNADNFETYLDYNYSPNRNHALVAKLIFHQDNYETEKVSNSAERRQSASGALSYAYRERYLIDVATQYGGTENFMKGRRFGLFPAVSAGWIISNERFLVNQRWISLLKLRASAGLVGNQNVGGSRFGYRQLYETSGSWNAGLSNLATGTGYAEADLGNQELTWEKSKKLDLGIDAQFFNQLNFSFTYFREDRTDILNSAASVVPQYLGADFSFINMGRVESRGLEAIISYGKQHRSWGYRVAINAAYQTNKVASSAESAQDEFTGTLRSLLNYPVGQLFGAVFEGYYTAEDILQGNYNKNYGNVIPGSIKFNGYQAIGKDTDVPTWEGGLNLGLNFKGVYIDAHLHGVLGKTINLRNSAPYSTSPLYINGDLTYNISKGIGNAWTPELAADPELAKTITSPSLTLANSRINRVTSSYWLENGDFLRIRNLELGYELPKKIISKLGIQGLNIYLRGTNLFTFDRLKYFDPEILEGYPLMKSYHVGVNLKF